MNDKEKILDRHRDRLEGEREQGERQAIADQLRKRKLQSWMISGEPLPIDEVARQTRVTPDEVDAEIVRARVEQIKIGEVLDREGLRIRKRYEEEVKS